MIGGSLIIVGVYLVIWGQGGDDDPKPFHSNSREDEDEDEEQEEQSPQQSCIKILDSDHDHPGHKTTNNYIPETIRNYVSISSHHSNTPTAKEDRFLIFSETSHHVPAITQPLLAASTNAVLMDGDQTS